MAWINATGGKKVASGLWGLEADDVKGGLLVQTELLVQGLFVVNVTLVCSGLIQIEKA